MIVIPTYKRLHDQKTWNAIHPDLRDLITFVVRPEEAAHFRAQYSPSRVMETDETVHDYASTMAFILEKFQEPFIYVDDDIKCFKKDGHGRLDEAADQLELFMVLFEELEKPYVGSVSVRAGWAPIKKDKIGHAQHNTQFMALNGALIKRMGWRFDRVKWSSDYDFNLQLLRDGYDTLQRRDYQFIDLGTFKGEGGCNSPERFAEMAATYEQLHEMWPDVLKPKGSAPRVGKKTITYPTNPYRAYRSQYLKSRRRALGIS